MGDKNHYETLGLDVDASFEEIQSARNRLLKQHDGDRKQSEAVEMAYDSILMDRLRLRQEGKIKVPDRIRFPERPSESAPQPMSISTPQAPMWAQSFLDNPSQNEVLWPAIAFSGVAILGLLAPSAVRGGTSTSSLPTLALTLGTIFSVYFLNRKENKFFRSVGITLGGLVLGVTLGALLGGLVVTPLQTINPNVISTEGFDVLITALVLWLFSSFLR